MQSKSWEQRKSWDRTEKRFSCKRFFEKIDAKNAAKKFYINEKHFKGPCEPDFIRPDDTDDFEPLKHLVECHGFMHKVPEGKKRSLEVTLCKLIEKSMEII